MGTMIGTKETGFYEVLEKLGSGGMGDVFKGRDPKTNQMVAIKILSDELSKNDTAKKRFEREVKESIRLKHPNLIAAYANGEFRGRLYYVMEFVDGSTVKKEIMSKGPLEESRTIEILFQIGKALEYAAQQNIIHRDIKPDNIMVTHDGRAKLCDMGLAKSTEGGGQLTILGTVLGTPHYMSPEQARGDEVLDTRTDMFSLGSTSYHMLTGSPPFEGNDPISIMTAVLQEDPVPIQDRNPKISDEMCAIIAKMMAKEREKRYKNFSELLDDLVKLKKKEQTSAEAGGYAPKSKIKEQKFKESFYPSEIDILVGQIAVHNKLITVPKLEECLNRQESLALCGVQIELSDIFVEQKIIAPAQKGTLDKLKVQVFLDRSDEVIVKLCGNHNVLQEREINEIQKWRKAQMKGLAGLLVENKLLDEEKHQRISASLRQAINTEESKALLKVALENNLVSQAQAEKCSRIYSNTIVMGRYKDLGAVFLEKGFLVPEALNALIRAIRRSMLTSKNASEYLQEKRST